MSIKKVAVIGSGTMGNGIAHVFAQNHHDVKLVDISAEALEKAIRAAIFGPNRLSFIGRFRPENDSGILSSIIVSFPKKMCQHHG